MITTKQSSSKVMAFVLVFAVILAMLLPVLSVGFGVAEWLGNLLEQKFSKTTIAVYALLAVSVLGLFVFTLLCRWKKSSFLPSCGMMLGILAYSSALLLTFNHYIYHRLYLAPASIFACASILMATYAIFRWGALIIWAPILLISAIKICFFYCYGTPINAFHLQEALHANSAEVSNFLTWETITGIIITIVLVIFILWIYRRSMRSISPLTLLSASSACMILSCMSQMLLPPVCSNVTAIWPLFEIRNTAQIFSKAQAQESRILSRVEGLKSPVEDESALTAVQKDDAVVVVVHVGESVRSDHLGLNGWVNNTTPRLAARGELINFSKCISSAPSTCPAFVTILTDGSGNIQEEEVVGTLPTVGNVTDFFVTHGFKSAAFLHKSNVPDIKDVSMAARSSDSTFAYIFNKLFVKVPERYYIKDKSMEQSHQIVRYCADNKNKNLFVFVNNMGSHGPFADYNTRKPAFTPTNHDAFYVNAQSNAEAVINAYDNTIAYQDEFIGNILDSLKGRPFVYIYISDHGEFLGEEGVWSRAALPSESYYYTSPACVVPMLIAYSPEFATLNPHINSALKQLRNNSEKTIAHGHFFHTLLGLFGIKTKHYLEEWDLCSERVKSYTGPRPAGL